MRLEPLDSPLKFKEVEEAKQYAVWLNNYWKGKDASPHIVDAWNLYRYCLELEARLGLAEADKSGVAG